MGSRMGREAKTDDSHKAYGILLLPDGDYELIYTPIADMSEALTLFRERGGGPMTPAEVTKLKFVPKGNKSEYVLYFCRHALYDMDKPESKWFAPYRGSFLLVRRGRHPVVTPLPLARLPRDEIQSAISFFWMQMYLSIIHPERKRDVLKVKLGFETFEADAFDFIALLNIYRRKHGEQPFDIDGIPYKKGWQSMEPPKLSGRRMKAGEVPVIFKTHASRLLTNKSVQAFVNAPVVFLD